MEEENANDNDDDADSSSNRLLITTITSTWGQTSLYDISNPDSTLLTQYGIWDSHRQFWPHPSPSWGQHPVISMRLMRISFLTSDNVSIISIFIPRPRHNSCRKGVCRKVWFPHGCSHVSYRSWDKSRNLCPCRNRTFPNSVHNQNQEHTRPVASCFPGPDDAPCWEMSNFLHGHGSLLCFLVVHEINLQWKLATWHLTTSLPISSF